MKKIYCKNNSEVRGMLKELSKEGYKWEVSLEDSSVDSHDFCLFIINEKRKTVQVNYEKFYSIEDWNKITEGDIVKIINTGKIHSTYPDWLIKNIEDKELLIKYAYGDNNLYEEGIKEDSVNLYIVRCVSEELAYIQRESYDGFNGLCYLINIKGLERVTSTKERE